MKKVVAVKPYRKKEYLIFQQSVFEAWKKLGGEITETPHPPRILHHIVAHYDYIHFKKNKKEARLKFMGGGSPEINAFPDNFTYEIIPMMWDCWPNVFEKVCSFLKRNKIQTAIFTSSMTAVRIKKKFPEMNVLSVTEGIDTSLYTEGNHLEKRKIDLIEFGRNNKNIINTTDLNQQISHIYSKNGERLFMDMGDFTKALANSKIAITIPRCDTHPEVAGDIETLTQRFWECMLSRTVMLGRAPSELIELIGYDPVISINYKNPCQQIMNILNTINQYQDLVDKNRKIALEFADWDSRIKKIRTFLISKGYKI